jgi:sugar lactone lactonase YvrE
MSLERKVGGANLYCMHTDGRIEKKLSDVTISNGLAWSMDGTTMYYIDTQRSTVRAFDYDAGTGNIANERVIVEVPEEMGHPDGMTIDTEGMLWVALFRGAGVSKWDPLTGKLIEKYDVGAANVTACTFGGPDLSTLYITTARTGTSDADLKRYPHAGGIFAIEPGVKGLPAFEFAG